MYPIFSDRSSTVTRRPRALRLSATLRGVLLVLLGDGNDHGLRRREPHRERTRVVLDEDTEEPLEAAEKCPVHHDRRVVLPVLADVLEPELSRVVEVHLDRGALPRLDPASP